MKILTLCLLLTAVLGTDICYGADEHWPKMKEFETSFNVNTSSNKIEFLKPRQDEAGAVSTAFPIVTLNTKVKLPSSLFRTEVFLTVRCRLPNENLLKHGSKSTVTSCLPTGNSRLRAKLCSKSRGWNNENNHPYSC